jgi:dTDP-4-dehydrorhamnose 3,5-epimerase-like enzyme
MSRPRPILGPGAYLAPNVEVHENVRLEPGAVVLAESDPDKPQTVLERGVVIGANATVLPGISVGTRAQVRPGSVVHRSVPPLAVVEGNPARIVGYGDADAVDAAAQHAAGVHATTRRSRVRNVSLQTLRLAHDLRGNLAVAELDRELPFSPARVFMVYDVPSAETRGAHAHRTCAQVLICVRGSVRVVVDDGTEREEFLLDTASAALHIPPMVWAIQYGYSPDALLLVLASERYDPDEYIRDYNDFLAIATEG